MAQQIGVRDYLRSKGFKDDEITYSNGTVYGKGQRIIDVTPQADGKTYATASALDNAYNNYDIRNRIAELQNRANTPNTEVTAMQQSIRERLSRPIQQFSYDQNTDPAYQNAVKQAQANAATATNNTLANLRARGQGKSSYSETVANQISQREMGNVTSNILPQLISQAYQRYMGQNQLENQQLGNMINFSNNLSAEDQNRIRTLAQALGLQNDYNQQQITNDRNAMLDAYNQKRDRIGDAQWGISTYGYGEAKEDPGVFFDQYRGATPLAVQQLYAGLTGYLNGSPTMAREAQDANFTGYYNGNPTMARQDMLFNQGAENRRISLTQDNNDRQWAQLDYEMSNGGNKYRGLNANQVLDNIRNNYTEPIMQKGKFADEKVGEQITKDPNRRYEMFLDVIDSGLPSDNETNQVLTMLGLSKKEIDTFKARARKEFGGNSGN